MCLLVSSPAGLAAARIAQIGNGSRPAFGFPHALVCSRSPAGSALVALNSIPSFGLEFPNLKKLFSYFLFAV
jgi:hypothetical protein